MKNGAVGDAMVVTAFRELRAAWFRDKLRINAHMWSMTVGPSSRNVANSLLRSEKP